MGERGRHRGVKRNFAIDFLHDLVNVAVQHRDRTEAFDIRQGLLAIVGSPAPIGIDRPQWNVCEENNRSAGRATLKIVLQPFQLLVTERSHTTGLQVGYVYKTDEMHALVVEAIPSRSFRVLSIALKVLLAVVGQHVMLTGHKVDLLRRRSL